MADDYELIDAGDGRRLERFGPQIVDRPAPAAALPRADPDAWAGATLRFDRDAEGARGRWRPADVEPWTASVGGLELELRPATGGQVGLFPEQLGLGGWLGERIHAVPAGQRPSVLNLFAYTGAATLVAARAGAGVAHVDASPTAVGWARRNAGRNGLTGHPIRWLTEDAARFVRREVTRRNRYDGVVLDPPSYGHGRGGRPWRLADDLDPLLAGVAGVLDGSAPFVLLTAHARDLTSDALRDRLAAALATEPRAIESGPLELVARSGARLAAGAFARWPR